jgi:hypothetical protein
METAAATEEFPQPAGNNTPDTQKAPAAKLAGAVPFPFLTLSFEARSTGLGNRRLKVIDRVGISQCCWAGWSRIASLSAGTEDTDPKYLLDRSPNRYATNVN